MKRNFLKVFIVIALISSCIIFYAINSSYPKHNSSINLTGRDEFFKVYLNMQVGYRNELMILPGKYEDFEMPSEIIVEVFAKDKSVYTDILKFIPSTNFENYGKYTARIDSNKNLERNYKDVHVAIRFNDEVSKILLKEEVKLNNS